MDDNFQKAMRYFSVFPARHGDAADIYESFGQDVSLFHEYMETWKRGVRPENFHSDYFSERAALLPSEWNVPAQYVYDFITGANDAIRINMDMRLAGRKVSIGYRNDIPATWMSAVLNGINYARRGQSIDSVENAVAWYKEGVRDTEVARILVAWEMDTRTAPPFAEVDPEDFLAMWKTWVIAEEPQSHRAYPIYNLIAAGVNPEYASAFPRTTDVHHIINLWRSGIPLEYATSIGE